MGRRKLAKETWETVQKVYENAYEMPCKPDESFRKVRQGDVIDEDMSVRWNREEVERLRNAYENEVKRLQRVKNQAISEAITRIVKKIAQETGLTEKQAELAWEYAYREHHHGDLFYHVQEITELLGAIREAGETGK